MLAGILLKLGGYGFLRLVLPLFPDAAAQFAPVLAVLAFYWGSLLLFRPGAVRASLVVATALAASLFVFAPFVDAIWYFIVAECCFVLFWRASGPAQMEILKQNVEKGERETLFSRALSLSHASGIIIGPILGLFLKSYPLLWKELFAVLAIFYGLSAWVKSCFYISNQPAVRTQIHWKDLLITPWRDSLRLLRENSSFARFQIGFFIAGSGLMFAKPSIPGFLAHSHLSFFRITCRSPAAESRPVDFMVGHSVSHP